MAGSPLGLTAESLFPHLPLMLIFCGTDQLPLPQKTLVPFLHLFSPRAAHEPQERKEAALQRVMHMLCLTPTSLSMLSSYSSQTEHFLQPVFTSSSEQEKAGQLLSQPSSPHTAALPFPAESLLWPYTQNMKCETAWRGAHHIGTGGKGDAFSL